MTRSYVAVAGGITALVAALTLAFACARPAITPLWALYVGDGPAGDREVLFLDPFPSASACAAAARAVGTSGQWTICRSRLTLSLGHSKDLATLREDSAPGGPWERLAALCGLAPSARDGRYARRTSSK